MSGLIPEDPGGLPLPFRHLHPQHIESPATKTPPARPPAAPSRRRRGGPGGQSWMAELLFEQSVGDPIHPALAGEEDPDERDSRAPTRSQLLDGYIGEEPPRTFAQYKALMEELFNSRRDKAVRLLAAEPVMSSANAEWNPKQSTTNAHIARELVPYVVRAMEQAYDFAAPPVEFVSAAGFLGTYDMKQHRIKVAPTLFTQPLKEFLDTLVHEEIHALQAELMLMLSAQIRGRTLSPPERAIARYWKNEEPKYRSTLAAGSQMSPETKRRYRMIGQEYHAWTTGHFVGTRLTSPAEARGR